MLYNILKQLQETPSTNDKLSILKANKDNETLKEYMRLVCCPSVSFYITAKTFPVVSKIGTHTFQSLMNAGYSLGTKELSQRHVTGQAAKNFIVATMEDLDEEHQQLYKMLLLKDIRAKVGATLVNKVWPNLCVSVPYQRCSLPDEKTLEKFKNGEQFFVQLKYDSSFAYAFKSPREFALITRAGSRYPKEIASIITEDIPENYVLMGELEVVYKGEVLSRKDGCGVLNSLLNGGPLPSGCGLQLTAWDVVSVEEFSKSKSDKPYWERLNLLRGMFTNE